MTYVGAATEWLKEYSRWRSQRRDACNVCPPPPHISSELQSLILRAAAQADAEARIEIAQAREVDERRRALQEDTEYTVPECWVREKESK